jgi:hypothetical protein
MPGSSVPVIRQPFEKDDPVPFWAMMGSFHGDHLFDRVNDPDESHNVASDALVSQAKEALREALRKIEAPEEQLTRLGLS